MLSNASMPVVHLALEALECAADCVYNDGGVPWDDWAAAMKVLGDAITSVGNLLERAK